MPIVEAALSGIDLDDFIVAVMSDFSFTDVVDEDRTNVEIEDGESSEIGTIVARSEI